MSSGEIDLLAAIVRGLPSLPRAACRGRHDLFDTSGHGEHPDDAAERHAVALTICASCPELTRCRDFYSRLPPSRRPGVHRQPTITITKENH